MDPVGGNNQNRSLGELPIGARLVIRCKSDWRSAAVSARREQRIVLTIASPGGRTYRKSCAPDTEIVFVGTLPVIGTGNWREGFVRYDGRW